MKIVTWNINGLRATQEQLKKLIDYTDADVICLQETKITKDLLTSEVAIVDGYNSYFSFSQKRAGYSGVATFCKDSFFPVKAQSGLSNLHESDAGETSVGCYGRLSDLFESNRLKELDCEGRAIITQHQIQNLNNKTCYLVIINVYCPRADLDDEERYQFKIDYCKALEERAKALLKNGYYVIVLGDINISHKLIDHCDPTDPVSFSDNKSRVWLDNFLFNEGDYSALHSKPQFTTESRNEGGGCFVDSFRYFYPQKPDMFTCWCTANRARETNYGTRLDYIFCDKFLANHLNSCEILSEFQGSDHCPMEAVLNIKLAPSKTLPNLCTRFYAEFGKKQQNLLSYFNNNSKTFDKKRSLPGLDTVSNKTKTAKFSQMTLTSMFAKAGGDAGNNLTKSNKSVLNNAKVQKPAVIPKKSGPSSEASLFWKSLLKGPEPAPLCSGHNESCVKRTVKKDGPNQGRSFYCCAHPEGHKTNPEARCQFFKWC